MSLALSRPATVCRLALALAAAAAPVAPASAAPDSPLHDALKLPDNLVLKVNLRTRIEGIEGQFRPTGPRHDRLVSFRTDIFAEYDAGRVLIGGELRDARGYAERHGSTIGVSEANALEPLQAYVALDLAGIGGKGAGGRLAAGRYTLETGAGRLIGRPDFSNSINSYTGLLLDWKSENKDRLVAFVAEPSQRLPNDVDGIRHHGVELDKARGGFLFYGADYTRAALLPHLLAEGYVYKLEEDDAADQLTRDRHLLTYGVRVQRPAQAGHLDFEAEAANQTGRAHATTAASDRNALRVRAHFVHAEAGYRLKARWQPRLSLHGDLATGDDADPTRYTRFDPLFGAARADFGPSGLYGALTRTNIRSLGLRAEATPSPRVDFFVMARALWLDDDTDSFSLTGVRDRTGRAGDHAGTQVEARVRYWITPRRLKLDLGGAVLDKGRFLRSAANAPSTGDTHYLFMDLAADF